MNDTIEDFMKFDPNQLDILVPSKSYNTNYSGWQSVTELNYPIDKYYKENLKEIKDAKTVVIYCYKELMRQSFEAVSWLRSSQFKPKSAKEDQAHENKKNQILSIEFQLLFYSKFNNIVKLAERIYEKTCTYSWEYRYYKYIMDKYINYIIGNNKDKAIYELAKTLVDGIMKITLSARWEYDTKSFIIENEPYSNKYILGNGKWTKINS